MRKWIIGGVALLVLVTIVVVALVNLNALLRSNKDYLIARLEESIGRDVQVGDIGVSLWGGIGARLKDFAIADDPAFSQDVFVRAADLQVNMRLLPLFRKEFQVSKLILNRPVIRVIRNEKGQFNFSTLGRAKEEEAEKKGKPDEPKERGSPPPFLIALVDVDQGEIYYNDKSQGIDFRAALVDLEVKEISLDRPVEIDLEAAVFGAKKQNLRIEGRVGPLGPKTDFNAVPVQGEVELQPVPLADLERTFPGFERRVPKDLELAGNVGTKATVSGVVGKPQVAGVLSLSKVNAKIPQLAQPITDLDAKINFTGKTAELPDTAFRIGSSQVRLAAKVAGFAPLSATYSLSSPELRLADLRGVTQGRKKPEVLKNLTSAGSVSQKSGALGFRGNIDSDGGTIADADFTKLQSTISYADSVATIESLSLGAFAGSLKATGRYDMRQSTPRFAADATVQKMDLTQIFSSFVPSAPQNIRGLVDMSLDLTGSGKEWDSIQKSLKGRGKAEVVNGALLDVNLAESVLGGATGIPGIVNLIPADVRQKYPAIFNSKDTEFKQLKGSALIGDGRARTDDLVISAAEFETQAKGWFAFDRTVDFRALLLLSERLSQDIIGRAKEIKALANEQGRIEIPFTLSGKLPGAKPKPDIGYIARAMQKGFLDRGLERLFGRRSPKEDRETPPLQEQAPSQPKERKKRQPAEEILRGLEGLFKR
jgi:AsmA protein